MNNASHPAARGSILLALVACAGAAAPALATPVLILSQYMQLDVQAQTATFHMSLSGTPDFSVVDSDDRQENSFQWLVDTDFNSSTGYHFFGGYETLISGSQIYLTGGLDIRFWDAGAHSWGPVQQTISFVQNGPDVQFTVPWSGLGFAGGEANYRVNMFHYGGFVQTLPGSTVPLPTSAAMAALGVLGLAGLRRAERRA
jgi:hypothetical protein